MTGFKEVHMSEGANEVQEPATREIPITTEHDFGHHELAPPEQMTPTSLSDLTESEEETTKEEKSPRKLTRIIIASAGGIAILGALGSVYILGKNSNQPHNNGAPDPDGKINQTVAPATPVATQTPETSPTPTESVSTGEQLSVPEISALQTPEQIGKAVVQEALLNWRAAGVTDTVVTDQQASGLDPAEYAAETSSKWATAYENALFVDNWQGYSDISAYVQKIQAQNEQNIALRIETANDQYPFSWSPDLTTQTEVVTDEGSGSQQVDVHVIFSDANNGTQNSAMTIDPSIISHDLGKYRMNIKLVKVGDAMKISSITRFNIG